MIRLKCRNEDCNYCYQVTELEMLDNGHLHKTCLICGSQMLVDNMEEIISRELEEQAEENLKQYLKDYGLEGTVELIERSPNNGARDLYMRKLKERGIIK
jgi:hypothetical protein